MIMKLLLIIIIIIIIMKITILGLFDTRPGGRRRRSASRCPRRP